MTTPAVAYSPAGFAAFVEQVKFDSNGLVAVIAQQAGVGDILMMAWMNRESLALTFEEGVAVYWSRSRQSLWRKGETSGQIQRVIDIRLDCDGDAILLIVDQTGVACHTGARSCFYRAPRNDSIVQVINQTLAPEQLYGDKKT